jgi:hypothetical protein
VQLDTHECRLIRVSAKNDVLTHLYVSVHMIASGSTLAFGPGPMSTGGGSVRRGAWQADQNQDTALEGIHIFFNFAAVRYQLFLIQNCILAPAILQQEEYQLLIEYI